MTTIGESAKEAVSKVSEAADSDEDVTLTAEEAQALIHLIRYLQYFQNDHA